MKMIKITEKGINYLVHPKGSIFAGMKIRENSEDAFDNAIKLGMKNPDDWMYMYSNKGKDYFKHHDTRNYISFPQSGIAAKIKKIISKIR